MYNIYRKGKIQVEANTMTYGGPPLFDDGGGRVKWANHDDDSS